MKANISTLALLCIASGCMSQVSVTKVTPANRDTVRGQRYFLPQPFLLVSPNDVGGASVEVIHLADPQREYAVETSSFLSKYAFEMKTENGLLKSVNWKPDDTSIPAQFIDSAGNIAKARYEAESASKEKEAEKAEKATEKNSKSQDAAAAAAVEYEAAKAEAEFLRERKAANAASVLDTDLAKAEAAEAKAQAKWLALLEIANGSNAFDAPAASIPEKWGPVLYRIVNTKTSVRLERVKDQEQFQVFKKHKKSVPATLPTVRFFPKPITHASAATVTCTIRPDLELGDVNINDTKFVDATTADEVAGVSVTTTFTNGRRIDIVLQKANGLIPPGTYKLSINAKLKGSDDYFATDADVRIQ